MNLDERKLMCGKAIKLLMKTRGARFVFQNIYKTKTRTVKCYMNSVNQSVDSVADLRDDITDLADMFNLDVKFNITKGNNWSPAAFIAKLY
jgi:hypothetical protein